MILRRIVFSCARACWGYVDVGNDQVCVSLASERSLLICESMWVNHLLGLAWSLSFLIVVKFWIFGVEEFKVSFDSWITATLTLCRSKKSPSSTCVLPMPFALNCRMVKGSPSEALVVVGDGSGFRYLWSGWGTARDACPVLNLTVLRCVLKTRTLRMNPTRTTIAHIAHPDLWRCLYTRNMDTW